MNLAEQADAFGKVVLLTKQSQKVVSLIQSDIANGDYVNAMGNFNSVVETLSKEETSLLSQLEQHSPKDYKDDSLD